MENLIQPMAVAVGSAVGSLLREGAEVGGPAVVQNGTLFARLFATGAGAALAGVLAAYMSPLGVDHSLIPQSLASDLTGGFLVGLLGGFVVLPALASRQLRVVGTSAELKRVILYIVGSLAVSIVFFLFGATLCRLAIISLYVVSTR